MKNDYENYMQEVLKMKEKVYDDFINSNQKTYVDFLNSETNQLKINYRKKKNNLA